MGTKVISFSLSPESIDRAIKEVRAYRADFEQKCRRLRELVGERIYWTASAGFKTDLSAGVIFGAAPANDVQVSITHNDDVTVIIADGTQAVFIEFGAGVYYDGPVGSQQNPLGKWPQFSNYRIGMYGKGRGSKNAWNYTLNGVKSLTHGTLPAMPMFHGYEQAIQALSGIVREVFG